MYLMHFGEYLSDNKIISSSQLEDITYSQIENPFMLAQLAFSSGYLTKRNLNQLLFEDTESQDCFTQNCISRGLITNQQAQQLLYLQSLNHNILCQNLSRQNIIGHETLQYHLQKYKAEIFSHDREKINKSAIDDAPLLNLISRSLRSFLFNEGYATNIESVSTEFRQLSSTIDFATQVELNKKTSFYMCVRLSELIVSNIAATRQRAITKRLNSSVFFDVFTEIMFCLTYRITTKLRKLGHKVKHGSAQAYLPDYKQCAVLRCNTIIQPIEIAVVA